MRGYLRTLNVLAGQVCNPITQLFTTSGEEAPLFTIQGVGYALLCTTPIATVWKVCSIYKVFEEEGINPILIPKYRPIHHGWWNRDPGSTPPPPVQPVHVMVQECPHHVSKRLLYSEWVPASDLCPNLFKEHLVVSGPEPSLSLVPSGPAPPNWRK